MKASWKARLAGPGYVILNGIRVINIITFLDIIAASAVMLVKISMTSGFFFFEAVTHAVTAGVSIFLLISELPWLRSYFDRDWPLLGHNSGFITLGIAMFMLGAGVLGNLNRKDMGQDHLGMTFWQIVLSAGILALVMSAINLVSSFVFADGEKGVTARQIRIYGAVAGQKGEIPRTGSHRTFRLSMKREDTLPIYSPQAGRKSPTDRNSTRFPLKIEKISSPPPNDAASSKYSRDESGIAPPDLAYHPALKGGYI